MSPWFVPLIWFFGVLCGRSVWFMRRMRSMNLAEARANAAARSQATATGVVIVGGPVSDGMGAVDAGGLAAVPSHGGDLGSRRAVVHGREVIDLWEEVDQEALEGRTC